jgi:arginine deiminase
MASSEKIRKRLERSKKQQEEKSKRRQIERDKAYQRAKKKAFMQEVKDTLGFSKMKIKGVREDVQEATNWKWKAQRPILHVTNPCNEIFLSNP